MAAAPGAKRGPSVLVTDARERQSAASGGRSGQPQQSQPSFHQQPPRYQHQYRERRQPSSSYHGGNSFSGAAPPRAHPMRLISVDNVLQYASEIPSGQSRGPPSSGQDAGGSSRRGRAGAVGLGIGTGYGASGTTGDSRRHSVAGAGHGPVRPLRQAPQNIPGRSSKVSEKLVLLPETLQEKEGNDEDDDDLLLNNGDVYGLGGRRSSVHGEAPLTDQELAELKRKGGVRGKSYAERLPKAKRAEKLARVTAYCTADGYKMKATAAFVKEQHGARTKLYDDCLYNMYHLPLQPGTDGFRVRSSPALKTPGGKAVLDEEIERSERRDYYEGYFGEAEMHAVRGVEVSPQASPGTEEQVDGTRKHSAQNNDGDSPGFYLPLTPGRRADSPSQRGLPPDASRSFAEMCVFSYGVVVFWNFTERQEKDVLADLTFAEHETGVALVSRPRAFGGGGGSGEQGDTEDLETEELHFEYDAGVAHPRVFNDMITLRSADHMVKLAISHAIAQSVKLSFFEEKMNQTMLSAEHVPKQLALTGVLGLSRREVVTILGRLFKSRVDVNLSSNILDVPKFFWDSEPTLHPLYTAIREYLEIPPRIKVLNERCRVFLDLAEILSDSIADTKMSTITWIVIVLIVISILVTMTEVILRFAILQSEKAHSSIGNGAPVLKVMSAAHGEHGAHGHVDRHWSSDDFSPRELSRICGAEYVGQTHAGL